MKLKISERERQLCIVAIQNMLLYHKDEGPAYLPELRELLARFHAAAPKMYGSMIAADLDEQFESFANYKDQS